MRMKDSFRILLWLFLDICLDNFRKYLTIGDYPIYISPIKTKILSSPFLNRFKYFTDGNLKHNTNILNLW